MVRYFIYFPMHILGMLLLFAALGGLAVWVRANAMGTEPPVRRKTLSMLHGLGILLILTGGFGLMKVVGIKHASIYPNWILVKFLIWFVLCFSSLILIRQPKWTWWFITAFVALGLFSATTGKFKQAVVPDRKVSSYEAATTLTPTSSVRSLPPPSRLPFTGATSL